MSEAGDCIDNDTHGVLIFKPDDHSLVGDTVQGVVLDHWRAGGWERGGQRCYKLYSREMTCVR